MVHLSLGPQTWTTETIKLGRQQGRCEHMMGDTHGRHYSLSCYQQLDQIRQTYANSLSMLGFVFFLGVINPAKVSFHSSFKST